MKTKLYAAYGSNLNMGQMQSRCPDAVFVGTGTLDNYELFFKGNFNHAFASVGKTKGSSVPVGIWQITPSDEIHLDRYEGVPSHYFKANVNVKMDNGTSATALIYIMNPKMDFGFPTHFYYKAVLDGYRDCGFKKEVLEKALDKSYENFKETVNFDAAKHLNTNFHLSDTVDDDYEDYEPDDAEPDDENQDLDQMSM